MRTKASSFFIFDQIFYNFRRIIIYLLFSFYTKLVFILNFCLNNEFIINLFDKE